MFYKFIFNTPRIGNQTKESVLKSINVYPLCQISEHPHYHLPWSIHSP